MQIDTFPTPNVVRGRAGDRPEAVVVHTTVGTFDSAVGWFALPTSGVSAHYLVGLDGRVGVFVDEEDTARHAGRVHEPSATFVHEGMDPNTVTIGIEFVDDGDPHDVVRPQAQYASGAELLWAISLRWKFPLDREHVVGHREIYAAKTCPGNLDIDRLLREAVAMEHDT